MAGSNGNLIRLTGLYENRSQKTGEVYFSGVLGGVKILLLKDNRAGEGQPGWALMIAERAPKPAGSGEGGR